MVKQYIKGLRGEIVSLDSLDRIWKVLDEKTSKWEVWVDAGKNSTQLFEGTEAEVKAFVESLDDLFEPYDLSNESHRERLKKKIVTARIKLAAKVSH